jgi:hypothetical protein
MKHEYVIGQLNWVVANHLKQAQDARFYEDERLVHKYDELVTQCQEAIAVLEAASDTFPPIEQAQVYTDAEAKEQASA